LSVVCYVVAVVKLTKLLCNKFAVVHAQSSILITPCLLWLRVCYVLGTVSSYMFAVFASEKE